MKVIKHLAEHIREELCDALKYAKCAMNSKDTDLKVSLLYYNLSKELLHHVELLHDEVKRIIQEKKLEGVLIPTTMAIIWEWLHEHMIDDKARIVTLLNMYKEE